jgi:Pectate lyase superfamily protein
MRRRIPFLCAFGVVLGLVGASAVYAQSRSYGFDSTAFANGSHTLSAPATYSKGRPAETTILVSFIDPNLTLSPSPSPPPSQSLSPSPSASPTPSPSPSPSLPPWPSPSPSPSPTPTCGVSGATGATSAQLHPADQPPYNAVADGITDDFAGIQQDINDTAAAGGGIVTLPPGTLLVNGHLVLKSNVKLMGAGNANSITPTIIKAGPKFMDTTGPNGGYPLISTNGAVNVTLANLVADQSGDTLNGNVGDRLAAYVIDIRSSSNALVDAVSTRKPFTYSIAAVGSNRFCIRYSDTRVATSGLYDQLDGIHVLDSSFGDVDYNKVDQRYDNSTDGDDALVAHTINGPTHDIAYVGNKARGGSRGDGMQIAVGSYPIYNLTIQNNEIYDSPEGIRTGYYDAKTGAVHDIALGGSTGSGNYIHDLRGGIAFPSGGNAIEIGLDAPSASPIYKVAATYNQACNAGSITVRADPTNGVANNTGCTSPSPSPSPPAPPVGRDPVNPSAPQPPSLRSTSSQSSLGVATSPDSLPTSAGGISHQPASVDAPGSMAHAEDVPATSVAELPYVHRGRFSFISF